MMEPGVVVCKSERVQTVDARWLCIENIYHKLNRPGYYDVGGTFRGSKGHLWINFKSEIFSNSYLLHLLVVNRLDESFRISLSDNNHFITEKNDVVFLSNSMKQFEFNDVTNKKLNYVFTYSFTALDIEDLENKKLYISFKFLNNYNVHIDNLLCHDFGELLREPMLSDFTIESSDGVQFRVHQEVLSVQSDVFSAMLKENTAEKQNSFLKLVDVNKDDLYNILEFMYTGTIKDVQNCNCPNLMLLADRYDLKDLCELMEYSLSELLTIYTVLDILIVADMCNSSYLKSAALKYIKLHPQTFETKAWGDFKNAELTKIICKYVSDPCS